MAQRLKTTLTKPELFLPSEMKGRARICVELLDEGQVYCSEVGDVSVKDTASRTVSVAVASPKENETE